MDLIIGRYRIVSIRAGWPTASNDESSDGKSHLNIEPLSKVRTCFGLRRLITKDGRLFHTKVVILVSCAYSIGTRLRFPVTTVTACSIRWAILSGTATSDCYLLISNSRIACAFKALRGFMTTIPCWLI